ncbi:Bacterial alpha-L-rhamnosidase [bacterium]|nr:Bacterial alpha-L-rhamnosidase [bacterium]
MTAPEGAFWIGSDHPFDLAECYLNFRRDLVLHEAPARAIFTLTADSRYRLWINGTYVSRGPARSWPHAMALDELDVTPHLRPGPNHLAVQVYCPGYSHFAYVHKAAAGWIGWLQIGDEITPTDRCWHVRRDASYLPLVPRVSNYGTGVERRDMRRDSDWQTGPASGWTQARIVQPPEGPIWSGLHPRDIPLLTETLTPLTLPWQTRHGPRQACSGHAHEDLCRSFAAANPGPLPGRLAGGETAIWIFDLGQSRMCTAGAAIANAGGGEILTVSYAERLRDGEVLLSDPATYCRMRPTDSTILRPGPQSIEPFSQRGARYLIFQLETEAPIVPDISFFVRTTTYPLSEIPVKPQDDATLDAVAAMCRRTILSCLQDGFVDSIWRESSQWLGDVVAEAFALQAISPDPRPLARAIDMAAAGAAEDGILPSVLPGEAPAYVVTDYTFAWIELLQMYLRHPGVSDGPQMIARHRGTLDKLLARLRADLGRNGLIRSEPGRRLFLDWSAVSRHEPSLTYNARYLMALQIAARLTANPQVRAQADQLRAAIRSRFHDTIWHESPEGPPASQLALAFLILTETVTGDEASAVAAAITARSLDPDDTAAPDKLILASPFMHHYVFQALDHLDQPAQIRAIIKARWGSWAQTGEATTWENWSIDFPDGSACHGFSSHPLGWLIRG